MPHYDYASSMSKKKKKKRTGAEPTEKGEENIGIKAAKKHKKKTGKSIWESIREGFRKARSLGKTSKKGKKR